MVRGVVLGLREHLFVEAARVVGLGDGLRDWLDPRMQV